MPKNERIIDNIPIKSTQYGMHDALINGEIVRDIPSKLVYVNSENDLAALTDAEPVGTFAVTFGGEHVWQLTPAGTWVEA
jgi:hypothetical protein